MSLPEALKAFHASLKGRKGPFLPADEPERAVLGYVVGDELIQWPIFGEPLRPDKQEVSPEELVEFGQTEGVRLCDDPVRLRLGFVQYRPDLGTAIIKYSRLTALKQESRELLDRVEAIRSRFLAENEAWMSERILFFS